MTFTDHEMRLLRLSDLAEGYRHRVKRPVRGGQLGRVRIPLTADHIAAVKVLRRSGKCWSAIAKVLRIGEERIRREFGAPKMACRRKARRRVR